MMCYYVNMLMIYHRYMNTILRYLSYKSKWTKITHIETYKKNGLSKYFIFTHKLMMFLIFLILEDIYNCSKRKIFMLRPNLYTY